MTSSSVSQAAEHNGGASALWPHQQAAVDKLAPLGSGGLFHDMGAGKTRTTLELLRVWGVKRVLILAPKSVVRVWPAEFSKHLPEPWRVVALDTGTVATRAKTAWVENLCAEADGRHLAVVVNYDSLVHRPMPETLETLQWDALVLDESHRCKAPRGKTARTVAALSRRIPHRLALTGTPMPHSPLDVWAQMQVVWPGLLPDRYAVFEGRYALTRECKLKTGRTFRTVTGYRNLDELQRTLDRCTDRVRTEEVLTLPDAVDTNRYCLLEPTAQRVYHQLAAGLRAKLETGEVTANNALTQLLRLAQVCNGYVPDDATGELHQLGTEKADLLADLLDDLNQREPLVVFGRFHSDLDTIARVAGSSGRVCGELSGRRNDLAAWQDGEADVLAVQLHAGGLGVDLTRARYQVYFAMDYNLGDYLQTRRRIHRPGQTRNVTYIHLLAAGTVDEAVLTALQKREEVVSAVVDGLRRA